MKRLTSAAKRTVNMFAGTTHDRPQENHAPKLVESSGVAVVRVAAMRDHAWHYAKSAAHKLTLCGESVDDNENAAGICQACRAEASKMRAVVK